MGGCEGKIKRLPEWFLRILSFNRHIPYGITTWNVLRFLLLPRKPDDIF